MIEIIIILHIIVFAINLRLVYLTRNRGPFTIPDNDFSKKDWIVSIIASIIPCVNIVMMLGLFIILVIDRSINEKPEKPEKPKNRRVLVPFNGELVRVPIKHFDILKDNKLIKWSSKYKLYTVGKNEVLEWSKNSKMFFVKKIHIMDKI